MVCGVDGQMQGDDGIAVENIGVGLLVCSGLCVRNIIPNIFFACDDIDIY